MIVDLSIDFDFFVREDPMWDFGHQEGGPLAAVFSNHIWPTRYAAVDLYTETDPQTYADFLPEHLVKRLAAKGLRFTGLTGRRLGVADSHRHAYEFFRNSKAHTLLNIDAHHDCWTGTNGLSVACDNWLTFLRHERRQRHYIQLYPKWKDPSNDGPPQPLIGSPVRKPAEVSIKQWADWPGFGNGQHVVGDIFICRSPVWVPPHHDAAFIALVEQFRIFTDGELTEIDNMRVRTAPTPEEAAAMREQQRAMLQQLADLGARGTERVLGDHLMGDAETRGAELMEEG